MLKRNEWWCVCQAHSGVPCCTNGRAALFETKRHALDFKRERGKVIGEWNLRIRKVAVT